MGYYKEKDHKKSIALTIISIVFSIIGAILIVIGYHNEVVSWFKSAGVLIVCVCIPLLIYVVYKKINDKSEHLYSNNTNFKKKKKIS